MCRLKNLTVAFILQNRRLQCTLAHYPREILRVGTLTAGPLCRESHPLYRLKNPTVVYMITCRLSFCKTGVYKVRLLITIERGCSSMYRKEERNDKLYAKEPLLAFLKAILVGCTLSPWSIPCDLSRRFLRVHSRLRPTAVAEEVDASTVNKLREFISRNNILTNPYRRHAGNV